MQVHSDDEAYNLCNTYALRKGFSIRKGHFRRDKSNNIRKRDFLCSKAGFLTDQEKNSCTKLAKDSSFVFDIEEKRRGLISCSAKKKISFVDQTLDYIEGLAGVETAEAAA
ncbi:hypothetical protein LWI28_022774 [Acer negundo]|uniref:FAR1 domain-containing protein n=1 Tax=Acer negundo TaxID=4023 RepID=A0AAD5IFT0_ACENE|nr:hypothetical protein LWI28_022774 [Acer negundo]